MLFPTVFLPFSTMFVTISKTNFIIDETFNSLSNDKILDLSKLKAFADENLDVNEKLKFALERVENIVGKGENAGYQHFLLFPTMFSKGFFLKSTDCW